MTADRERLGLLGVLAVLACASGVVTAAWTWDWRWVVTGIGVLIALATLDGTRAARPPKTTRRGGNCACHHQHHTRRDLTGHEPNCPNHPPVGWPHTTEGTER